MGFDSISTGSGPSEIIWSCWEVRDQGIRVTLTRFQIGRQADPMLGEPLEVSCSKAGPLYQSWVD